MTLQFKCKNVKQESGVRKMKNIDDYSITLTAKIKNLKKYKRKAKKLCKHLKRAKSLADEIALLEIKTKIRTKNQSSH